LTNIAAFDPVCVDDQFPGCVKARLSRLVLPELEVESPVKFGQFAMSFDKACSHRLTFPSTISFNGEPLVFLVAGSQCSALWPSR
jgi:hypothetical protein